MHKFAGDHLPIGRLSFLYAALFFELGVNLPFFPVWLRAQSLDDAAVGLIVATPFYVRLLANPLVSAFADRTGRLPGILSGAAVVVALSTLLLLLAQGFWPILLAVVAIALAQGPLIALTDTLTLAHLRHTADRLYRYGGVRLWGSIAFALANVLTGTLLVFTPASAVVLILIGASAAVAVAAVAAARIPLVALPTPRVSPAGRLGGRRLGAIALVVAGGALVQASHGTLYAFSALQWQAAGFSSATTGVLWAIGILCEILFFLTIGRVVAMGIGPGWLALVGAVAAVVRWLGMSLEPTLAVLVLLQTGHALSFGATHIGTVFLLARLAPGDRQAQAQAWLAAAWAGVMAVLISLSGALIPSWGARIYLVMAAVAALGVVLLGASLRLRPALPANGAGAA